MTRTRTRNHTFCPSPFKTHQLQAPWLLSQQKFLDMKKIGNLNKNKQKFFSIRATTWSSHSQHWIVTETVYSELFYSFFLIMHFFFKVWSRFQKTSRYMIYSTSIDKTCARNIILRSKSTCKAVAFSQKEYNSRNIFVIKQLAYYGKVRVPLKISCMPSVLKKIENRFFISHRYWVLVICNFKLYWYVL